MAEQQQSIIDKADEEDVDHGHCWCAYCYRVVRLEDAFHCDTCEISICDRCHKLKPKIIVGRGIDNECMDCIQHSFKTALRISIPF